MYEHGVKKYWYIFNTLSDQIKELTKLESLNG